MSSPIRLLALAAGLVLAAPAFVSADGPYKINYNFHEPNDLKAYDSPGPNGAVDGQGQHLSAIGPFPGRALGIEPGRPADPALANDPNAVRWPTLDKSVWEATKSQYNIKSR